VLQRGGQLDDGVAQPVDPVVRVVRGTQAVTNDAGMPRYCTLKNKKIVIIFLLIILK
jgi:hypothetical protein